MPKEQRSSPWKLAGLSWKEVARRTWTGMSDDDVFGRAAQVAYYFFFAIFPLAIFLVAIMGLVVGGGSGEQQLTAAMMRGVPSSAGEIVRQTIHQSVQASGGGKLGFGIVIALFSASAGMTALIDTLNKVYDAREERGMVKQKAIALFLTIITGILVLIAIGLFTAGSNIAHHILGGGLYWVWNIAQYPVAVAFLIFSFAMIYYFAPNVEHPEWHWVTPGAAAGVVLWILGSVGLREYLHYSNSYTSTYGLLGAVMVLLLWFYVTGVAILAGGEVNAVIEHASGEARTQNRSPRDPRLEQPAA